MTQNAFGAPALSVWRSDSLKAFRILKEEGRFITSSEPSSGPTCRSWTTPCQIQRSKLVVFSILRTATQSSQVPGFPGRTQSHRVTEHPPISHHDAVLGRRQSPLANAVRVEEPAFAPICHKVVHGRQKMSSPRSPNISWNSHFTYLHLYLHLHSHFQD